MSEGTKSFQHQMTKELIYEYEPSFIMKYADSGIMKTVLKSLF